MKHFIRESLEAVFCVAVVGLVIYLATLAVSLGWHQGSEISLLKSDLKVVERFSEISAEYAAKQKLKGE